MEEPQPPQTIVPHDPNGPAEPGDGAPPPMGQPDPTPDPAPNPAPGLEPASPAATAVPSPEAASWQFRTEDAPSPSLAPLPENLSWSAAEFIEHQKSPTWYALLILAGAAAAALDYFATKDKISTGIILFAAITFGVFAARKPRTQDYSVNRSGLQIGVKSYGFQDFKTFSIAEEGAIVSIVFMPLKRFMPPLTIYVAPDMEDKVVDYLSACLPLEQHKADAVDSFMRRIHF